MNDINLIRDIERYLEGDMNMQEKTAFEKLCQSDPVVNEQLKAHRHITAQLESYGRRLALQEKMDHIHASIDMDMLRDAAAPAPARVITFRRRLLTNVAAAACIALVTSLSTIALIQKANRQKTTAQYEDVRRVLNNIQRSQNALINDINSKKRVPANPGTYGGTGFAITDNGYVVTNYHVVAGADSIYIQNTKGEAYKATSVFEDISSDLAILKITDSTFRSQPIPYAVKFQKALRGEKVFTLGYPRDEIVYGEGYISAQTGFNGDSAAYQVSIPVNPGNSGAPLMDAKGDVVGIVTGKQTTADGIAFAVKSAQLKRLLEEMPKEKMGKWNHKNRLENLTRVEQIKKLEDFVYMVKVYN
ncbi:S1C family serine protease [Chitinophaga sancti]|uniref:S1C family serine protease n=1 Tax=Chitinophaga sancti TaxID=1004 RepID=A0A1K1PUD6_9BACT|nr:S1C family serine protease [Chitinophaga sancti]WQD61633.1 S1C family serine protease [Chitinophaga sancti]WQG92810.1 S1C family serine protease [Chitinophaga sancti]SFW51116.1 Trypsin-like peptidase domain-containing protein [Chitinophaga sancti]